MVSGSLQWRQSEVSWKERQAGQAGGRGEGERWEKNVPPTREPRRKGTRPVEADQSAWRLLRAEPQRARRKTCRVDQLWSKKGFDLGCPLDLAQIESRHEVTLPSGFA